MIYLYYRKKTKPHPDVQNIYIEQQEKTLTNLHVPRDLSSGELSKMSGTPSPGPRSLKSSPRPSPVNSPSQPRKNLFPNIVNITKNISSGIKLPKFNIPKLDKRGDTAKDSGNDKEMAMDRSENSVRRSRLSSHGSHDDCEIDLKDRHSHDFDDMVLRSCGILETSKMPASEYPIAQKPKPSSTEEREEEDKGVPKEEEESKSKKLTNVPKIQTPNTTTRKMHRIFDAIQQELEARIGDRECHTKFIFL